MRVCINVYERVYGALQFTGVPFQVNSCHNTCPWKRLRIYCHPDKDEVLTKSEGERMFSALCCLEGEFIGNKNIVKTLVCLV